MYYTLLSILCLTCFLAVRCGVEVEQVKEIPQNELLYTTQLKVEFGEFLFNDKNLSINGTIACASCHFSEYAFSDTSRYSTGVNGLFKERNSTPLFNLDAHPAFFRDGGSLTLEMQVVAPIENENEMGHNIADLCSQLNEIELYKDKAKQIFNSEFTPFVLSRSLGAYLRSLKSYGSKYDEVASKEQQFTDAEERGRLLFLGKANCIACHSGLEFSDFSYQNNGLYKVYQDKGRERITLDSSDRGKFKVPSLRNLSFTAPYMHDGSLNSLDAVIEHYNNGGKGHFNQSKIIKPLNLSSSEVDDLKSFLLTLNDYNFMK